MYLGSNEAVTAIAEERFLTWDDGGVPLGLVPRSRVHRLGLWHRAANVLLFRSSGLLLLQQRSATKDVCPDRWDLSAAEHLKPGETYLAGAQRGLEEELGLEAEHLDRLAPLGGVRRVRYAEPARRILDCELQQSFLAVSDAPLRLQEEEVAATRELTLAELAAEQAASPGRFTPWFLNLCQHLDLNAVLKP